MSEGLRFTGFFSSLSTHHSPLYKGEEVTEEIDDLLTCIVPRLCIYLFACGTKATRGPHSSSSKGGAVLHSLPSTFETGG